MRIVKRTVSALKTFGARFAGDRRGNVALIFTLVLPPLLLMTLGGVEIARVSTVRMSVQDALDAATLAAARSKETDSLKIKEVGYAALRANVPAWDDVTLDAANTTFTLDTATGKVVGNASVNVKTLVANIFLPPYGRFFDDHMPAKAHSEVERGNFRMEIALVIDNTGSMEGAKLTNTKAAAKTLIDRLEITNSRLIETDAIKISLVPFSMTVRATAGGTNTPPHWMRRVRDHTGGGIYNDTSNPYSMFDGNATDRFTLFDRLGTTWGGCVEVRGAPYDIRDTPLTTGIKASQWIPFFNPDNPDEDDYPNDRTWNTWGTSNDYVDDLIPGNTDNWPFGSRSEAADARKEAWFDRIRKTNRYSGTPRGTLTDDYGPNRGCKIEPIIPLTNDFDALRAGVDRMVAYGATNVPLGAMWGWHTLSPHNPFGDGSAYDTPGLKKIIIIMTDGENNLNANWNVYGGVGFIWQNRLGITSGTAADIRARLDERLDSATPGTEDLCGNMKDKAIEVYTIAVEVDTAAQALLQRCATSSDHYFPVDSASGIVDAFEQIADAIERLRISR